MSHSESTMKTLQKNYDHLSTLPIVKKLNKKVSKLKNENKALQRVIMHFGESLQRMNPIEVVDLTCDSDESLELPVSLNVVGRGYNNSDTKIISIKQEFSDQSDEEHIIYNIEENFEQSVLQVKDEFQSTTHKLNVTDCELCDQKIGEASEEEEEVEASEEEEEEVEASEEEEEEEVEASEEEEEEEEEVFEITIRGKTYFTADAVNGEFYAVLKDDEIGDEVGSFKKGIPQFN